MKAMVRVDGDWPADVNAVLGSSVDFHLSYKGRLPANGGVKVKDLIRKNINGQLWELVKYEPRLRPEMDSATFADLKGRRLAERTLTKEDVVLLKAAGGDGTPGLLVVELKNHLFCPLIDRRRSLVCHLDIKFLTRDEPGGIVHGGDLDNRIKTLFDALRIPQSEDEVPGKPGLGLFATLCLLEDDSLITKLSIASERLLDPVTAASEHRSDVRLEIGVSIKPRGGSDHWMGKP